MGLRIIRHLQSPSWKMPMNLDVQGRALAVLNRLAQADWPDRLKLRKSFERLVYRGSRAGFRLAARPTAAGGAAPRAASGDGVFDLSLSDEQRLLVDTLG